MKLIGYWMENLRDTRLPLPQELAGDQSHAVRDAICDYLGRGKLFETYRGCSWCRFHCGIAHDQMGCREFTDGEWIWPEGLAHYVKAHNILLPEEFISCATSTRSPHSDVNKVSSLEFWQSWAEPRRSPSIRQRLAVALAAAQAAEPALIDNMVNEIVLRETESAARCVYSGCTRPALAGRKICARHMLSDDKIQSRTAHLYQLPTQL